MNLIYVLEIAFLISLSSGLELSLSGNVSGIGYNETIIECPNCNVSANATHWIMESPAHDIFG
jgi:hypothetical protein